jgi:hypothetical protein
VCTMSVSKRVLLDKEADDSSREESDKKMFRMDEPLVVKAVERIAAHEFLQQLTHVSDAQLDTMFETYIARNAQHVCQVPGAIVSDFHQTRKFRAFTGPWTMAEPDGDMRRGIRVKAGSEADVIGDILANAGRVGLSLVFPSEAFGADIVIVARRQHAEKCLLLFVQCKSCMMHSTSEAMRRLEFPYHINRDTSPQVPAVHQGAWTKLQAILKRPNLCVVFAVVKYLEDPNQSAPEAEIMDLHLGNEQQEKIKVMKVIFDHRNLKERLPWERD